MKNRFNANRLDPAAFARAGALLEAVDELSAYPRLAAEQGAPGSTQPMRWSARGEQRSTAGRSDQAWLHLRVDSALPMTCQRCLEPVEVALEVDRWFRFVEDEQTASVQDEESEEEVLMLDPEFNLRRLIEDEMLLALPIVPLHDRCPVPVTLTAADPDFDESAAAAAENPFSALGRLRKPESE